MTERDERRARIRECLTPPRDRWFGDLVKAELDDSQRDREALASLLKPIAVEDNDGALAVLVELAAWTDPDKHTGDDPGGCVFCHAVEIAKAFLKRTEPADD